MKEKMSEEKKAKLLYSGELILFSLVFLVLFVLEIVRVIKISDRHHTIFNWLTIFGGTWVSLDFILTLMLPKRRKKNSLLDKCLALPLGIYLITYDIISFVTNSKDYNFYLIGQSVAFIYIAIIYAFEGIYHYKHPIPMLLEELNKEKSTEIKEKEDNQNDSQI